MIRVASGTAKNKILESPNIPDFRAVQEIAKNAVFSILGQKVENSVCLDLFAGSGSMGIEALSRNASWCDFVDHNRESVQIIKKNLESCNLTEKSKVYQLDAVKFVKSIIRNPAKCPGYDFVFLDPFYADIKQSYLLEILPQVLVKDLNTKSGIVVFFHGENLILANVLKNSSLQVVDSRKYGKSYVDFLASPNQLS